MNKRILVVEDEPAVREDYTRILVPQTDAARAELDDLEAELFGMAASPSQTHGDGYEVVTAAQGQEALALVEQAAAQEQPFATIFLDMRMPPGWDGLQTAQRIREVDQEAEIVFVTAYSDHSINDLVEKVGTPDKLLYLKKPFHPDEIRQLARGLTTKWNTTRAEIQRREELLQAAAELSAANQEIQALNVHLEQRIEERTAELRVALEQQTQTAQRLAEAHAELQRTQSQLLQAAKMAAIGQLAAGVAHEINNPIGFVGSNLNTLGEYFADLQRVLEGYAALKESLTPHHPEVQPQLEDLSALEEEIDLDFLCADVADLIRESRDGVARIGRIVRDLREFSHVDTEEWAEADLNANLESALNIAWNELKYKATVEKEYGELPLLYGNHRQLNQVWINLLVNAAQAIPERGEIRLRTAVQEDTVAVIISDTGTGIPPEVQARIFEPFFTTKEVGQGTGLGLSVAYTIVEKHHGTIEVESEEGQGTTFTVRLPLQGREGEGRGGKGREGDGRG